MVILLSGKSIADWKDFCKLEGKQRRKKGHESKAMIYVEEYYIGPFHFSFYILLQMNHLPLTIKFRFVFIPSK